MVVERLNKTETQILRLFPGEPITMSHIASELKVGVSWISRCVAHLEELDFLSAQRDGMRVVVQPASNSMGDRLLTLLTEEPGLDLDSLMGGAKLCVLPLLLYPGYSSRDISVRTGLTMRSVQLFVQSWRSMGLVIQEKDLYHMNQQRMLVVGFVREYSHNRNMRRVRRKYPNASIVWEDRDDYMISLEHEIEDEGYIESSTTILSQRGYDVMYRNHYYYYSPVEKEISEAEALVQNLMCNPRNPRSRLHIHRSLEARRVTKRELRRYAKKYTVEDDIDRALQYEQKV